MPTTKPKQTVNKRPAKVKRATTVRPKDGMRARAFEIFQARMQTNLPGDQLSDWLQAERELDDSPESLRT
ncbi:MAG: DUF2934 domain-containing protein [Planctomycetes bacterium]|nr:DUF2934 domain-containing protein [Planctomycetota bacterium]